MEDSQLMYLHLHSPLFYIEAPELSPFNYVCSENDIAQESLFCFKLNEEQAQRIDPDVSCFLDELVFAGKGDGKQGNLKIPAGRYLFSQQRKALEKNECITMAIEQQKDGLWERAKPENLLYIRRLYEDGSPVTQIIRPVL